MKTGATLIREIDATEVAPGGLAFWWLGQMGYVAKVNTGRAQKVLYLDPYLAPRATRQVPPLLDPGLIAHADYVLGSHDHGDHIDPLAIRGVMEASPQARVVTSRVARRHVLDLGAPAERAIGLDEGLCYEDADGLRISAIAAQHESFDRDATLGFPYLSFIVEAGGLTLFHAGDTLGYDGQVVALARWRFDVAFLPINGRDAERLARNCIGNMTYQEAVDLAGTLAPGLVVPGHYDMFADNPGDPQAFVAYLGVKYPALRAWVGAHGERVVLNPRPR
jgi:L-ascorbate 6-phosphate lactonase